MGSANVQNGPKWIQKGPGAKAQGISGAFRADFMMNLMMIFMRREFEKKTKFARNGSP